MSVTMTTATSKEPSIDLDAVAPREPNQRRAGIEPPSHRKWKPSLLRLLLKRVGRGRRAKSSSQALTGCGVPSIGFKILVKLAEQVTLSLDVVYSPESHQASLLFIWETWSIMYLFMFSKLQSWRKRSIKASLNWLRKRSPSSALALDKAHRLHCMTRCWLPVYTSFNLSLTTMSMLYQV